MFFHLSSVFIYLIVTEEGNHLVQIGAIEEIAVLMDVCMYVSAIHVLVHMSWAAETVWLVWHSPYHFYGA